MIGNHIKFDKDKTINAVLYVAHKLKRKDMHKIFKVLYFADREHLATYGRPITGDVYYAMPDGPVPTNLYDILKSARGDGFFANNGFDKYFEFVTIAEIKPLQEPDLNFLSKTDIAFIDDSIELHGDMPYGAIRNKSHDLAWKSTSRNCKIFFEDILKETGSDDGFIRFVEDELRLKNICEA